MLRPYRPPRHTPPRPGMLIVADKGFAGREFAQLATDYGATLLRPQRRDESQPATRLGWIRQRIESVNWSLKGQLGLEQHGGGTPAGVFARVAQGARGAPPSVESLNRY